MIRSFLRAYDLANIPRDRWLASQGRLGKEELRNLSKRERCLAMYRFLRGVLLFPLGLVRGCVNAVRLLGEFERLHAAPRRRMRCGRDCVVDRQTWIVNGESIRLGGSVKISAFSTLIAGHDALITIGSNTIIGPGVVIVAINHGIAKNGLPIRYQPWKEESVEIGEDVWIGGGAILLPGARVGAGSVIGAGAVVKGEVPAGVIAVMRDGRLSFRDRT